MKLVTAILLIASLLLAFSFLHPATALSDPYSCGSKCAMRCMKADVKPRCMKYCGICCLQCKCVPSGTFGNKHECPCYRDKVNKKGTPKCP